MRDMPAATPSVLVVVPALNEEDSVAGVLEDVRGHVANAEVVVVDDGSTDGTAAVARRMGATVLSLVFNLGIGGAVQTGLQYARDGGFDVAVQFDGDGQHLAQEIPRLVAPILADEADMVIGSRFLATASHRSSLTRRVGICALSMLARLLTGERVRDVTSGFRAYNQRAFSFLATHYPTHYPEPEAIIWACRHGLRLVEVPTEMRERLHGRSSITPWRSIYYILRVSLGMIVAAFRVAATRRGL